MAFMPDYGSYMCSLPFLFSSVAMYCYATFAVIVVIGPMTPMLMFMQPKNVSSSLDCR